MIDTDRYQPILAAMKAEPVPIRRGQIVVHPPEIGSRVGRLDFADRPRCTFDKIEHRPSRIIDDAPASRNARCDPSGHPARHRAESHRHRNLIAAHSRNSRQPGASSKASRRPHWRRFSITPSVSRNSNGRLSLMAIRRVLRGTDGTRLCSSHWRNTFATASASRRASASARWRMAPPIPKSRPPDRQAVPRCRA